MQQYKEILLIAVAASVLSAIFHSKVYVLANGDDCKDVLTQATLEVSPLMLAELCNDNSPSTIVITSGDSEWEDNVFGFCTSFDLNIGSAKMNHTLPTRALSVQLVKNRVTLDAALVAGGGASYHGSHLISVWGHQNTRFVLRIVPVCPSLKLNDVSFNSTDLNLGHFTKNNSKITEKLSRPASIGSPFRPPGSKVQLSLKDLSNWKKQYRDTYNHETGFLPYKSDFPPRKHRKRVKPVHGGRSSVYQTTTENSVVMAKLHWMEQKRLLFEKKMKMLRNYVPDEEFHDTDPVSVTDSNINQDISSIFKEIEQTTPVWKLVDQITARSTNQYGAKRRVKSSVKKHYNKPRPKQKAARRKHFNSLPINFPSAEESYIEHDRPQSTRVLDNSPKRVKSPSNRRVDSKMTGISDDRHRDTLLASSFAMEPRATDSATKSTWQIFSTVSAGDAIASIQRPRFGSNKTKVEERRRVQTVRQPTRTFAPSLKTHSDNNNYLNARNSVHVDDPIITHSSTSTLNFDQHFSKKTLPYNGASSRLAQTFPSNENQLSEHDVIDDKLSLDITSVSSSILEIAVTMSTPISEIIQSYNTHSVAGTELQSTMPVPVISHAFPPSLSDVDAMSSSRKTPTLNVGNIVVDSKAPSALIPSIADGTTIRLSSFPHSSIRNTHPRLIMTSSVGTQASSRNETAESGFQHKHYLEEIIMQPAAIEHAPETVGQGSTPNAIEAKDSTPSDTVANMHGSSNTTISSRSAFQSSSASKTESLVESTSSSTEAANVQTTSSTSVPNVESTSSTSVPNVQATSSTSVPNVESSSSTSVPNVQRTSSTAVPNVESTSSTVVPNVQRTSSTAVPNVESTSSTAVPNVESTSSTSERNVESTSSTVAGNVESTSKSDGDVEQTSQFSSTSITPSTSTESMKTSAVDATLRTDHSTSQPHENSSSEGDTTSSDTLWPVVAALVVGIPSVIVFGIAITVIHRRRLAQPVQTSITTSTLYPSL